MSNHWSPLDEELAEHVMGWKLVRLSDPEWAGNWPAWPRETRMRLAWYAQDPEDACCRIEVVPGTGKSGKWEPRWIPRLSTDLNWTVKLCEGIRARHGHLTLLEVAGGAWRAVIQAVGRDQVAVDDPLPAMAIAKAALEFCTAHSSTER